jgi:uncharacterized protein YqeY
VDPDPAAVMRARIRTDLKQAMQDRRPADVSLLRTLLAEIDNAQAPAAVPDSPYRPNQFGTGTAEVPRRRLSAEALRALLEREAAQRRDAAAALEARGRAADAETLRREADAVMRYAAV